MKNGKKSFTLIELLVVISIIGLISSVALVYVRSQIEKARDARRISDMKQIQKGLEMYFDRKEKYPDSLDVDMEEAPEGWDVGNVGITDPAETFIQPLVDEGIFSKVPIETVDKLIIYGTYRYHRYSAVEGICGGKAFYILAAHLGNSQTYYGVNDEVDPCYSFNLFWQDPYWYTIMGIEQ